MAEKVIAIKVDLKGTEAQQKKLARLETEVKKLSLRRTELNKALKKGTISLKQYGKEIAEVNTKLKANRRAMLVAREQILGMDSFTKKLGKSFNRLGTAISGAFVGLFAIQKVFDIFREGVEVNKQFEKSISELSAITGQSGEELDKLSDAARRMGKETTKSAVQVAEAFTVVGSKRPELLKNADALIEVTEAAITLSEAAGIEVPEAAQAVTLAMNQFGDSAGGAAKIIDVLAAASVEGSVLIPQLAEELSKFGGIAEKSGLTVAQAAASVEVVGKTVQESGTKIRNILIKLESGVEKFRPSVVGLNTALDNLAKDGFNQIAPLAKTFGKQNAEAALSIIQNRAEVERLTSALDKNGIAQQMAITMTDNLDGAQKRLGSAFDELFLTIGDASEGGALTNLIDNIAEGINGFSEWANSTGFFTEIFKILTKAFRLATLPIRLVYENLKALTSGFTDSGDEISTTTKVLRVFGATIETVLGGIKTFVKNIVNGFSGIGQVIKAALSGEFTKIPDIVKNTFNKSADNIVKFKNDTVKSFKDAVNESVIQAERQTNKEKLELDKRIKQIKDANKQKEKEEKALAIKLTKEEEALAKKKEQATKNLIKKTRKLKEQALILEIEDKREAEDKKLELAEASAKREVEASIASAEAKGEALKAIEAKFQAQRESIARTRAKEDKKIADKEAEKEKAESLKKQEEKDAFKKQVQAEAVQLAEQTANALVDVANRRADREKQLELDNLNAKLENGLISQEQFESERLKIEKKAFEKKKKLELAGIAISLASEIASINMNAAANPANAFTFGGAGVSQAAVLTALAVGRSAVQAGVIASQRFAQGGFTGEGYGSPDSTGFKQAGIVHEGEYVVPKHVLESQRGGQLVGALESMRMNKPTPLSNIGFANGGFTSGNNLDLSDMESRISNAVISSIGAIKVQNVATDTTTEAVKVNNIMSEATFG
jgi:TP901 family phage tail tape measure protein|tara:strand:+ start:4926 stop:7784 length:2859 start_codon:yes stop_codon:yes gene_type:complete